MYLIYESRIYDFHLSLASTLILIGGFPSQLKSKLIIRLPIYYLYIMSYHDEANSIDVLQKIFLQYKQPFAITYLGTSLMVIYLPIALCKDWISRLLGMNSFKKLHSDNNPLLDSSILHVPLRMNDMEQNFEENLGSYCEKDTNLGDPEKQQSLNCKIQDNKSQGLSKLEVIRCSLYLAPIWFVTEVS